jgi:GxxExxY protein
MHPFFPKADILSGEVIGAVIEVHWIMGPGLLESIYERCLVRELELLGIPVRSQQKTPMARRCDDTAEEDARVFRDCDFEMLVNHGWH